MKTGFKLMSALISVLALVLSSCKSSGAMGGGGAEGGMDGRAFLKSLSLQLMDAGCSYVPLGFNGKTFKPEDIVYDAEFSDRAAHNIRLQAVPEK